MARTVSKPKADAPKKDAKPKKSSANAQITSMEQINAMTGAEITAAIHRIDAAEAVDVHCDVYYLGGDKIHKHPKQSLVTEVGTLFEGQGKVARDILKAYGIEGMLMIIGYADGLPNAK